MRQAQRRFVEDRCGAEACGARTTAKTKQAQSSSRYPRRRRPDRIRAKGSSCPNMRTSRAVRITGASAAASPPAALAAKAAKARPRASQARSRPTRRVVNRAVEARLNAMESRQPRARTQRRRRQSHLRTAPRRNSTRWKKAEKSHPASRSVLSSSSHQLSAPRTRRQSRGSTRRAWPSARPRAPSSYVGSGSPSGVLPGRLPPVALPWRSSTRSEAAGADGRRERRDAPAPGCASSAGRTGTKRSAGIPADTRGLYRPDSAGREPESPGPQWVI